MKKIIEIRRKYIPPFFLIALALFSVSILLIRIAIVNEAFADFINATILHGYRRILAAISDLFPFSVLELSVALLPAWLTLLVIFAVKAYKRSRGVRYILTVAGILLVLYSGYLWGLSMPYHVTPIDDRMGLDTEDVTSDDIYELILEIRDRVNDYAALVGDGDGAETRLPYSFSELCDKLNLAYEAFDSSSPEILTNYRTRPKRVIFGSVMSDLHIVGVYSFFTGEANVSTDYPDYNTPFTTAHEMAHQRGVLRENEANFVAYLVCLSSDDSYIRYSAYLNMLEHLASALKKTDYERYLEIYTTLSDAVIADMKASAQVYLEHKDSFIGKLMESFNDNYIKQNGSEGTVSYGLVVRLAVAYHAECECN